MNFYRSIGRWYVQFDWDAFHGIRLALGRWPAVSPFSDDEYAADDVPHPFADPDALTGNITAPITAQSFQAIKEAHEDSQQTIGAQSSYVIDVTKGPYVPNPVNQTDEE